MSQDRNTEDEQSWLSIPMCSLKHAEAAREHYGKRARAPLHPDELGAIAVLDVMPCGRPGCVECCCRRRAFFQIADSDFCEVRQLPPLHAASAQAVHAEAQPQVVAPRMVAPRRQRALARGDDGPLFVRSAK